MIWAGCWAGGRWEGRRRRCLRGPCRRCPPSEQPCPQTSRHTAPCSELAIYIGTRHPHRKKANKTQGPYKTEEKKENPHTDRGQAWAPGRSALRSRPIWRTNTSSIETSTMCIKKTYHSLLHKTMFRRRRVLIPLYIKLKLGRN